MSDDDDEVTIHRRKFLKSLAAIYAAGGLSAVGLIELRKLVSVQGSNNNNNKTNPNPPSGGKDSTITGPYVQTDALVGFLLDPNGTESVTRNPDGSIASVALGPLVTTVTRNPDGSIASVTDSLSSDGVTETETITRNPDGSIASVAVSLTL
jgi:hypothetical protein